jgi:hypothetical protein
VIAEVIGRAVEQLQVAVNILEVNKGGTVLQACVRSSGWRRRATRSTTNGWAGCSRASRIP